MRSFGIISPQFWTGRTGREIQAAGADAVIVAVYLMTSPHSHMCGLYYLSKAYIAEDTGRTLKQVTNALQRLSSLPSGPFAIWDEASKYVWVPTMMFWQLGGKLKPNDNRVGSIIRWYQALPSVPFLSEFFDRYQGELPGLIKREGASEGLLRGATSSPLVLVPVLDPVSGPDSSEGGAGETKLAFGESGAVQLTQLQYDSLKADLNGSCDLYIQDLDDYSGVNLKKFNQYSDHCKVIRTWYRRDVKNGTVKTAKAHKHSDRCKEYGFCPEISV